MPESSEGQHKDSVQSWDRERLLARLELEKGKMYGIAYAYLRNETDALEAVQETVCRAWIHRKSLRNTQYFSTWLIRILINVCMNEKKKRKRMIPSRTAQLIEAKAKAESGQEAEKDSVDRLYMEEQINKLPPNYRMVIVLKYYRDLTIHQIAEMMDKPDGTIRTWLHKALKKLRIDLGEQEEVNRHERLAEEG